MDDIKMLYEVMKEEIGRQTIKKVALPSFMTQNINQRFQIREYQEEAFQHFLTYWHEDFVGKPDRHHLLFHMATGSGKTFVMAGLILYLYEQGYRNFLFFVNSTSIIEKTRDNFLNKNSLKYLFNQYIQKEDKQITIQEVQNFQNTNENHINIAFTTIQGLHTTLHNPKENGLTFDDFEDKKIVLISDEAHHINAETKAKIKQGMYGDVIVEGNISKEQKEEITSWESTVNTIFKANSQNVLLEFTATIDYENNRQIKEKYADKLIYDYPLSKFRENKYSKEIELLQSDVAPFEQALQAVLLSQYRRKIFEKYNVLIKPVVLFKTKTIAASNAFQKEFLGRIKSLTADDLLKIKTSTTEDVLLKVFNYLESNSISLENFIYELQEDFSEKKLLSINSKEESIEKQIAINSLEDPNNEYRAIFAVDKLNEGWDVLNLFDIVRIDAKRDARNNVPGATTVKEAQLIGRGARYCPFTINIGDNPFIRKFDEEHELQICETLYYHSSYNPKYIQELKSALKKTGLLPENSVTQKLLLKPDFKKTEIYQKGVFFTNKAQKYIPEDVVGLPEVIIKKIYKVSLKTGYTTSSLAFEESKTSQLQKVEKDFHLTEFGKTIVHKAILKLPFYSFSNLQSFFPQLESIHEFISSKNYLGGIRVTISGAPRQLETLLPDDMLYTTVQVLDEVSSHLAANKTEYSGTKEFCAHSIKEEITDKYLSFTTSTSNDKQTGLSMNNNPNEEFRLNLEDQPWYAFNDCYGSTEEKYFLKYIAKNYEKLKEQFEEVYVIRNEKHFKIFAPDGRATEPDFLLIVSKSTGKKKVYFHLYIEPKGSHLRSADSWKEDFLTSISTESHIEQIWPNKEYHLVGMPFYTQAEETYFDEEFKKRLGLSS